LPGKGTARPGVLARDRLEACPTLAVSRCGLADFCTAPEIPWQPVEPLPKRRVRATAYRNSMEI